MKKVSGREIYTALPIYFPSRYLLHSKFYYPTGVLNEEGIWKGNKWVGQYKFYHPNGNTSYDWSYNEQGKREGTQKYYHENGKVMIEGDWKDGKESGILKEYDETGKLIAEKNFADGKLDASSVKIYSSSTNTNTNNTTNVVNDNETHVVVKDNTQNANVGVFDANGYNVTKTKFGKVDREGQFQNGRLMDGKRYFYDEEQKLIKTNIYKNGNVVNIVYPD
jgi:antitoxin component YwqK of YwqJK toxin-antitoxin module